MKFDSAQEMLAMIVIGIDLYSPSTNTYAFLYNESGSIAVYDWIDKDKADELAWHTFETGDYWGSALGPGGEIYDSKEYMEENKISDERPLTNEWCEQQVKNGIDDWIDTNEYWYHRYETTADFILNKENSAKQMAEVLLDYYDNTPDKNDKEFDTLDMALDVLRKLVEE